MSMAIVKRYLDSTLDNYICETQTQENLVEHLRDCIKNGFEKNIILTGNVGTGKTHLCYAILNALEEKRKESNFYSQNKVYYTTVKEIIDSIRRTWAKDADEFDRKFVERFKSIPLLIVDEVGVQYGTESERIELFEVFNSRYNDCLPTLVVSNNNREKIEHILGKRIVDRLWGGAVIFELTGKSMR